MPAASVLDFVISRSPAQPVFRWWTGRRPVVLAYHDVQDVDRFGEQMRFLVDALHPVSADDLCAAMAGGPSLPRDAVLVTFDDGDRTVLERGFPLLKELRIPAVMFVVSDLIDSLQPFWWIEAERLLGQGGRVEGWPAETAQFVRRLKQVPNEERIAVLAALRRDAPGTLHEAPQLRSEELRRLERGGVEIGSHTASHPCLDRCDDEQVVEEVRRAHHGIADALGHWPRLFAYPNGNWDPRVAPVLRALDYQAAFLFDHRIGAFPPEDRLRLSRVRVNSTTSRDRFRTIVSGLHPTIHRLRGGR